MAYTEHITILVDTREQKPLSFSRYKHVSEQIETLKQGDYTAILHTKDGDFKSRTVFDRKNKGDLWGTMSKGHDRFAREYNRSIEAVERLVLITENSVSDIADGFCYKQKGGTLTRSKIAGDTMLKTLFTMKIKNGLEVVFCDGRTDMKRYMVSLFLAECRYVNRLFKEKDYDRINRIVFREEGSNEETIL